MTFWMQCPGASLGGDRDELVHYSVPIYFQEEVTLPHTAFAAALALGNCSIAGGGECLPVPEAWGVVPARPVCLSP